MRRTTAGRASRGSDIAGRGFAPEARRRALRAAAWAGAVLALLLVPTPEADAGKASKGANRPKPERIRYGPDKELAAHLAERTGIKSSAARMQAAEDAGPRTITGTETLSGTIYASSLVIAEGSDVTIEGGATFCISGDLQVEAKVTGALRPPSPGAKRPPVEDILFEVGGTATIGEALEGANGRDMDTFSQPFATSRQGQPGERGQGFGFAVGGELYLEADIVPGRGGDGEPVTVEGVAPPRGLFAGGGDGGPAGNVTIVKPNGGGVHFQGGQIRLRRGGRGGSASVKGLAEDPGADCSAPGRNAGPVTAIGGNGGRGSVLVVGLGIFFLDAEGLPLNQQTAVTVVDEDFLESPAAQVETLVTDSAGGDATALGGPGVSPPDCPPAEPCPTRGRKAGRGGRGANATAIAGNGGSQPCFGIPETAFSVSLLERYKRFDLFAGRGGFASATAGNGGKGANAAPALRPARGGRGGAGGDAEATPGAAGFATQLVPPKGVRVYLGRGLLPDLPPSDILPEDFRTLVAALYPSASALGGRAGNGGNGGDCCGGRAGSPGGRGGKPGTAGKAAIRFPFPGVTTVVSGGIPHYLALPGSAGTAGADGQGCTNDGGGGSGTGSPSDPFTLPVFNGPCAQLDPPGDPLVGFDFYLPDVEPPQGLANPPRSTVLEFGSSIFGINGSPRDYRVEIYVNGRKIRDEVIPDVAKVAQMAALFVRTPASGKLCVEIRIDGAVRQRLQFDMS